MNTRLEIDQETIARFCQRHHIRKLSLFGSVLRADFGPQSDVDVLVEFEPGKTPGFEFFQLEQELSELIGRKVDLNTAGGLSQYFRSEVEHKAELQYVAV